MSRGDSRAGASPGRASPRDRAEATRARRAAVEDPEIVLGAAAAFLAVRPRSVAETARRLRHLGYRTDLVESVVARLVELGYLDDEAFARTWIESRDRARPRGEHALRQELALKGVPRDVVDALLAERAEDVARGTDATFTDETSPASPDRAAAERLLVKKRAALLREPDERKRRQKAYALLARSGFDPEICREVAATLGDDPTP